MPVVNSYLYDVLEVEPEATLELIKDAYRRASKKHHPDIGGSEEVFSKIALAYKILSNEESREVYDLRGLFEGQEEGDLLAHMVIQRLITLMKDVIRNNIKDSSKLLTQNILKLVIDLSGSVYASCQNSIRELENAIENANLMASRCIYKGEGTNIFQMAVEEQVNGLKQEIKQQQSEMDIAKRVVELLNDYEYKV